MLIGPIGVGKSTVAELLAASLAVPTHSVDDLRAVYYAEMGYDEGHADVLRHDGGMRALYEYWKPFEAHAVERVLQDHSGCVFDLGAGHSVFEDPVLFERARRALRRVRFVILLLPSQDPDESIRVLSARLPAGIDGVADLNEHFVRHRSNAALATHVVYTGGKSPEDVRDEILSLVRG